MSYLDLPRLHFFGEFIAEPSTINNDPGNYSGAIVEPGWNPKGDHRFALANCKITAINSTGELVTSGDPLLQTPVVNGGGPPARLVDLDVEVQLASQVFGFTVVINDGAGNSVKGTMAATSFRDFFGARLLGVYQSTLRIAPADWRVTAGSWLDRLRTKSPNSLSIRMITDLYTGLSGGPHRGRCAGVIGPANGDLGEHYVAGRRMVGVAGGPSAFAALKGTTLTFDVGTLVGLDSTRQNAIYPQLLVGLKTTQPERIQNASIKSGVGTRSAAGPIPTGWKALGALDTTVARYQLTSGIESLTLSVVDTRIAGSSPLGLFSPQGAALAVEADDGLFVFPDRQAIWTDPGSHEVVSLIATRFGSPAAGIGLNLVPTKNAGQPGIEFPQRVTTSADGRADITFDIKDPGVPRPNNDGQILGVSGPWADAAGINIPDAGAAIAFRVFSEFTPPPLPRWDADILPILGQYGRLFPSMAALIDLQDYAAVSGERDSIRQRLLLPVEDSRYMPITRDLSAAKKQMIVAWIDAGCPR